MSGIGEWPAMRAARGVSIGDGTPMMLAEGMEAPAV